MHAFAKHCYSGEFPEQLPKQFDVTYLPQNRVDSSIEAEVKKAFEVDRANYEAETAALLLRKGGVQDVREGVKNILLFEPRAVLENSELDVLFSRSVREKKIPELSIRLVSEKIGHGLFAEEALEPAQFIGEYTGHLRRPKKKETGGYAFNLPVIYGRDLLKLAVDSEKEGNHTRFLNHSPRPNVEFRWAYVEGHWRILMYSSQNIRVGEQLFIDYGPGYWKGREAPSDL